MIVQELKLFDLHGGEKGKYLTLIYNSLLAIMPTSVESERAFSTAGRMMNKMRCRMGDDLLDEITVLNRYFLNNK